MAEGFLLKVKKEKNNFQNKLEKKKPRNQNNTQIIICHPLMTRDFFPPTFGIFSEPMGKNFINKAENLSP